MECGCEAVFGRHEPLAMALDADLTTFCMQAVLDDETSIVVGCGRGEGGIMEATLL